jgi:cation transport ATPase
MKFNFVILCALFLGSCTITKRVHNPGWHVEWKHTYSANEQKFSCHEGSQAEKESIIEVRHSDKEERRIAENNFPLESGNDKGTDHVVTESKFIDIQPSKLEVIPIENEAIHLEEQDIQKTLLSENSEETQKDKKMPPPLKTAVTLTLISLFVSFIVLASVSVLSTLMFILLVLTQLTLSVFAVINSNQALRQIKAKPDLWKGKKLAKFLLFFGIIGFVALLILQVIAFNMLSNQYNFDALFDGFFL